MGFGLIFMGWATLLFFRIAPFGLIGALLMYRGLNKLCPYGESFKKAKKACLGLLVYFVFFAVLWALDITGVLMLDKNTALIVVNEILYYISLFVFSYLLYKALGDISKQTGFEKGILRENKCLSLLIVMVIFTASKVPAAIFGVSGYIAVPVLIFEMLWLFYSAMYIYSCYMMIATQEIIDEENKKMREYDEKYSMLKRKKK